jgi:hypothetical protein
LRLELIILGQAADVVPGVFGIIEAAPILTWLEPCIEDFVCFVSKGIFSRSPPTECTLLLSVLEI